MRYSPFGSRSGKKKKTVSQQRAATMKTLNMPDLIVYNLSIRKVHTVQTLFVLFVAKNIPKLNQMSRQRLYMMKFST